MKIFLVGMPGSGKTTLGRQLASELLLLFTDLDKEIERREGKSIADIFSQQGEDYFRQVESTLLREWAGSTKSFVMATGGGAPCFFEGMEIINQTGLSIFLDVPVTEIMKRLEGKKDRPLLNKADENEREQHVMLLREKRLSCYSKAKIILHNPDVGAVLEALRFKT